MNTKEEYLKFRNSLFEELDIAKSTLESSLYLKKQLDDLNFTYTEATQFFELTRKSLARTAFSVLTNLYEMRIKLEDKCSSTTTTKDDGKAISETQTLHKFLNCLDRNHKAIFGKDKSQTFFDEIKIKVNEHRQLIKGQTDTITKLKCRRDKYGSHFDKKYFNNPDLLDEQMPITPREAFNLINLGKEILKAYPLGKPSMYVAERKGHIKGLENIFFKLKEYNDKIAPTLPKKERNTPKYEWDFDDIDRRTAIQNKNTSLNES